MLLLTVLLALVGWAEGQTPSLLQLEKTVELSDVQGRIDHMSVDVKGQRLFVSALGNNTVEVIDFREGKRIKTIGGLKEPQGVLYVPDSDRLYVASGKDGRVRIFDGTSYALLKTIEYGDDADNLRYDSRRQARWQKSTIKATKRARSNWTPIQSLSNSTKTIAAFT